MSDMAVRVIYPIKPDEDIIHAPVKAVENAIAEMKKLRFDSCWGDIRFKYFQDSTNFGTNLQELPKEALIQFEQGYACRKHRHCEEKGLSCRHCERPDTPISLSAPIREKLAKAR